MTYLLFQMMLYMLVALILGVILGWLIWGRFSDGDQTNVVHADTSELEAERDALRAERDHLQADLDLCHSNCNELQVRLDSTKSVPVAAPIAAPVVEVETVGSRPEALSGPRDGVGDDLKKIKGIAHKLEALLHSLGFYHFDQIANWTDEELAWVDYNLEGFKGRASRDEWIRQARELM